jgi:cobalt-zinc-cadmium efflux system outer membrane protein
MVRASWAALGAVLLSSHAASGAVLTLDDALARARREAPAVLAARLRGDEAGGRLAAATPLLRDNPVVEAGAGRRDSPERGVSTDVDARIEQTFELGGRRAARIAGARAAIARETAGADDQTRRVLADVAAAFLQALAASERLRVLRADDGIVRDLVRVAERRHAAGDIADLEVNVARVAAARARAGLDAADAALQRGLGDLRAALGMDPSEPLELRGELQASRMPPLADLLAASADRSDLRALAREAEEADADVRLGEGLAWPDVGVRVGYKREERADIPGAGIALWLPIFAAGQELRTTGAIRARRLRLEVEARRRAIAVEVGAGFAAYERLAGGVDALAREALPLLDDNDVLSKRSWEAGELSMADYLVVRRETLDGRLDYVGRALEAALAAVDLQARAGVLR